MQQKYCGVHRQISACFVCSSMHQHTLNIWGLKGLNWSSKLRENDERKNTHVGIVCVLSDLGIKDFWLEVVYYFSEKISLSQNLCYNRGSRFSQYYFLVTINSSPMLVTKSVFKLIFCYEQLPNLYLPFKSVVRVGRKQQQQKTCDIFFPSKIIAANRHIVKDQSSQSVYHNI